MLSAPSPASRPTTVGHPVDITSGVVFTAWHDFELLGYLPLIWRRFYSTANVASTPLGRGWVTPFLMSIREEQGSLILRNEEGQDVPFAGTAAKGVGRSLGHELELRAEDGRLVIWDWHHQRRYFFSSQPVDGKCLLVQIEDYSGNTIILRYDQRNRLRTLEQSGMSRTVVLQYGEGYLVKTIELHAPGWDPRLLVSYDHNSSGHLTKALDPMGQAIRYAYDEKHRLIRETNQLGGAFHFEYDADGRCTRSWGDDGYLERRLKYDTQRGITRVTDSMGSTTTYFYGADRVVKKKVDPYGNETTYQSRPGQEQRVNALGFITSKEYDEYGNLVKYTDALGRVHEYTYNDLRLCTSVTDPDGHCRLWNYDSRGLRTGYENPLGHAWNIERGKQGEIISETDPEGRQLRRRYGDGLRWLEVADALGYFRCEYDVAGRPIVTSDIEGVLSVFETDAAGRITAIRLVDDSRIEYRYDAAGNVTQVRHLNGGVWTFEYDAFGHNTRVVYPGGASVRARYDTEGRRVAVINARGEEFRETLDLNGRPAERMYFDGRIEKFEYDAVGQLTRIHRPDGSVLHRKYDPCGNMIEEALQRPRQDTSDDNPVEEELLGTYEYNWKRRMLSASNSAATITFTYDAAGNLVCEGQNEFELHYTYDKSGKLIARRFSDSRIAAISFAYDNAGQLQTISDEAGIVQEFTFNSRRLVTGRRMRGGIVETLTYDQRNRLIQQDIRGAGECSVTRSYTYDGTDSPASLEDSLRGKYRWEYDLQGRLRKAVRNDVEVEEYEFEAGGNLLRRNAEVFAFDQGSRLKAAGQTQFEFDENGNLRLRRRGDEITHYAYDGKGRLTQVTLPGGATVEFAYDPLGRRIAKRSGDGEVRFAWSNDKLAVVEKQNHDPVELLIGCGGWRPAVQWAGRDVEHIVCSLLGTPHEVFDSQGEMKWWGRYEAFGALAETEGAAPGEYCLRFPGQWEDVETGLFYNVNRYYDPLQTRYLTVDPIGIDGGLNLYDYPRNPLESSDPLGLRCPNPILVERNDHWGWEIYQHEDGTQTIRADCRRGFASRAPGSDPTLRPTIHAGDDNAVNLPEAHQGRDGRLIVMEGTHRSAAASHGTQMPSDPDNTHLGGVPGRPGYMEYEYSPQYNDPNQVGTPLTDLRYPPAYPHQLPP